MSGEYSIRKVNFYDNPSALTDVLNLQKFMPEYLRESPERIVLNLQRPENINMLMLDRSGEAFCYAFASPQDARLVSEFAEDDPSMPIEEDRYYVDQVVAKKEGRRGVVFFSKIVLSVFEEANKMGVYKFSVHALCANGVDKVIARVFRHQIYSHRKVTLSRYGATDYVYMEAVYGAEANSYLSESRCAHDAFRIGAVP